MYSGPANSSTPVMRYWSRSLEHVVDDGIARTRVDGVVAEPLAPRVGELHLEGAAPICLLAHRVETIGREQVRIEIVLEERRCVGILEGH